MPIAFAFSDLAYIGLAVFLVAAGLAIAWLCLRLAGTFAGLSSFIRGMERELLPVISKAGGTVDRVNAQLDKLDHVTDSAVDAVDSADKAVRTVSLAVRKPVQKVAGAVSGITHGFATLRARRNVGAAVERAKEAARRREADLDEELRRTGG